MANKEEKKNNPSYRVNARIRRDWGEISPVTKVIPNKKKNQKPKHKNKEMEEQQKSGC